VIRRYSVTVAGQSRLVEVEEEGEEAWRVVVTRQEAPEERRLTLLGKSSGALTWLDGTRVVHALVDGALPKLAITLHGVGVPAELADARTAARVAGGRAAAGPAGPLSVRAPIPGRVARLLVKKGDQVAAGAGLVVLEAMKMENEIRSPRAGSISEVLCTEGAAVESGQPLVVVVSAP
jgi:biotin carboxyl carrier protein